MKKPFIAALAVFLAAAAVFSILYFRIPALRDYDSYFHTKMGQVVLDNGLIKAFPWAEFTFARDHYVNPYFLFHAYLGLWLKILPSSPFVAVKLGMLVLIGLIAVAYFRLVRTFNARWAWLGVVLLPAMLSYLTYDRMTQVRPHVPSLLILLLGTGAILARKWWLLGALSLVYVYTYSAPHLLPAVAFLASAVFSLKDKSVVWQPFAYSLGGLAAGLLINPYFPRDLSFFYTVTFRMGARPASFTTILPTELVSITGWQVLTVNLVSFAVLFLALTAAFVAGKKLSARSLFLFVTAGFFFVLLMRSLRFVEYWPFFASLCACSILAETAVEGPLFGRLMKKPAAAAVAAVLLAVGALEVNAAAAKAVTFVPLAQLKEVMDVLDKDANPGDIVFSKDWDQAQPMFYLSDKVHYLMMFDPEMMRMTHPGLYDLWFFIITGRVRTGALPIVRSIETATNDPEITRLRLAMQSGQVRDRLPDIIKSAFRAKWIIWSHKNPNEQREVRSLLGEFPDELDFVKGNDSFSLYRVR